MFWVQMRRLQKRTIFALYARTCWHTHWHCPVTTPSPTIASNVCLFEGAHVLFADSQIPNVVFSSLQQACIKLSVLNLKELTHCWLYEQNNGGWWPYEERISPVIKEAYHEQKESVQLQLSGLVYVMFLKNMIQFWEERLNRWRHTDWWRLSKG